MEGQHSNAPWWYGFREDVRYRKGHFLLYGRRNSECDTFYKNLPRFEDRKHGKGEICVLSDTLKTEIGMVYKDDHSSGVEIMVQDKVPLDGNPFMDNNYIGSVWLNLLHID